MAKLIQTTFPDEYIDQWAEVWLANPALRLRGITPIAFLQDPQAILRWHMQAPPEPLFVYRELLPEQHGVQARLLMAELLEDLETLDEEMAAAIEPTGPHPVHRENGALVEPLAHHRHPDRRGVRSNFKRRVQA